MPRKLVPKPHLLHSKRNRNWNLHGAIHELADNAIGHGAADEIYITVFSDLCVTIRDNGVGIDDINRVFTFGDSSSYTKLGEIGQYGVGATDAALWLGDILQVETVRDGRYHVKKVDWRQVEKSGEWPDAYEGAGVPVEQAPSNSLRGFGLNPVALSEHGSRITIGKLGRRFNSASTEKLARHLGRIYGPAIRQGCKIHVQHYTKSDGEPTFQARVEAHEPPPLTDEILISGTVQTAKGEMRWHGRAGLSSQLTKDDNQVHISFGPRVIEQTRDPFNGASVPTLYVEVALNAEDGWKHSLSDHKDRILQHRDELCSSIREAIAELIAKSEKESHYLALKSITVPIESTIQKALKGIGILHVDPDEEPEDGGEHLDGPGPIKPGKKEVRTPTEEGDPAKPVNKPTGLHIDWVSNERLNGKPWGWEVSARVLKVELNESTFRGVIDFPPKERDQAIVALVTSFIAHGIEMEYWQGNKGMLKVFQPKLRSQIEEWAEEGHESIAPRLHGELLRLSS